MMNFDNVSAIGENNTLAIDVSKYGNNGTISGATWNLSGKYGSALSFNGSNEVSIPDSGQWAFGNNNFSISLWIYFSAFQNGMSIMTQRVDGNDYWSLFWDTTNGPDFRTLSGGSMIIDFSQGATTGWSAGQWHNLILVRTGNAWNIYRDGTSVLSTADSDSVPDFAAPLKIAKSDGFNGSIDEVRIWNRSLNAAEIQQHYYSNLYKYDNSSWTFYTNQSNLTTGT